MGNKSSEVYFSILYDWMKQALLGQRVIQVDETTLRVNRDGRPAGAWFTIYTYKVDVVSMKDSFRKVLEKGLYKDDLFTDL